MSVASKNLFAILGNTEEGEIPAPVKTVEKTSTHTAKRNTDGLAPAAKVPVASSRRGGANVSGNEAAFRDRNAGRDSNRGKTTEETPRGGRRGGYRGRGGRREEGDRHPSKTAPHNSEKQAAASWGGKDGEGELKDEQAGAEIAQTEQKAEGEAAPEAEAKEEEPEEKQVSYEQYLAQQAEKKAALAGSLSVRKPNEGAKDDKWKDFAPLEKNEDEELFPGTGGKAQRQRERKQKQFVEIENRYVEPERTRGGRGGRGGARGDAGRGRGRGAPRGGEFRGGRGGRQDAAGASINTKDESAFPSLGKQ